MLVQGHSIHPLKTSRTAIVRLNDSAQNTVEFLAGYDREYCVTVNQIAKQALGAACHVGLDALLGHMAIRGITNKRPINGL